MIKAYSSLDEFQSASEQAVSNPEKFWEEHARQFTWRKDFNNVLEWDFEGPSVKWFQDGELNITENCIDRHLAHKANQTAISWVPNDPNDETLNISYQQLSEEVNKWSNLLHSKGVQKGDRVCLYMPMIPELAYAILACARLGAIHSVVFAGFSAKALADRINDSECKILITADEGKRGTKKIGLKSIANDALESCSGIDSCLVFQHTHASVGMKADRDFFVNELLNEQSSQSNAISVNSEDPLFILYTSGSTGKPKGVVHSTAGYMVYANYSFSNVFQYQEGDVYWCTADIGWITGHSYIIYGPLLAGATTVMFEGVPTYPDAGRFWEIVEDLKVNIFYTAPTAIRALQACGDEFVEKYDLSSLRVLGTVGEPINEEAWHWYNDVVGKKNCPIVDTWWQTETGGVMISPLAGITPLKPCYATLPLPGIQLALMDSEGKEIEGNDVEGNLCVKFPWPSMIRTTWGDHDRCKNTYFSAYNNHYFTGDGCKRDANGMYRITGRVDDVINVSGHRLGTAEIEDAINQNEHVVESAVVGFPHDIKGQGIYAYVICIGADKEEADLRKSILVKITDIIGPIAKPDKIQIVAGLPKTRSGKIMRRILRKIAAGEDNFGDTSTLLDPSIVSSIKDNSL
jgi:acetyl-CoA synthetase